MPTRLVSLFFLIFLFLPPGLDWGVWFVFGADIKNRFNRESVRIIKKRSQKSQNFCDWVNIEITNFKHASSSFLSIGSGDVQIVPKICYESAVNSDDFARIKYLYKYII